MVDKSHKNVLLMVADDLGLMLGCYGLGAIKTPHIDQLAAEGVRFTHAFASTASCSGSRSTIYTGLHTHQNGQYGLQQGWCHFQTHDHIETAPAIFNAMGYQTGIIGKIHVGPDDVYPWEVRLPSLSRDVRANAEAAGRFLDMAAETGRPFHLTIGFRDPHRDETRGGFGNDEADVRDLDAQLPDYRPDEVEIPLFLSDVPELRAELAGYYKSISRMDLGVGLVLEELRRRGLDGNTLVVFVSDNGSPFLNSKTTLYDAGVRLPLLVRKPGNSGEGGEPGGVTNPNMVSFLDILPTCIDWAGISAGGGVEGLTQAPKHTGQSPPRLGTSFLRILTASDILPADTWQQHVFGSHTFHEVQNYWPTRFLRDRRFKYHRNIAWRLDFPFATDLYSSLSWEGMRNQSSTAAANPPPLQDDSRDAPPSDTPEVMIGRRRLQSYIFRGPEELFDLDADPEELVNLARRAEHAAKLGEMRALLEAWQYRTGDVWLFRDGVSVVATRAARAEGLRIPDRFDFDPRRPGSEAAGACWVAPAGGEGAAGEDMMSYG